VSAYARQGYIDHTQLDHTSILKFIQENWEIEPLAERDAKANNFLSAFDFTIPPREPMFISGTREQLQTSIQPRRSVIYIAYGAALLIALYILIRASMTSDVVVLKEETKS
jgi:phospholipase C